MDLDAATWPPRRLFADGLTVRAYRPGDGVHLAEAVRSSYEHLRPWMPWARPDSTAQDYEKTVEQLVRKFDDREDFTLAVLEGESFVGSTGYHIRVGSLESRNAEIGMWIRADRSGQGTGTRLLKALIQWGFDEWGFERLVWRCDPENRASARVAEKCGMVYEGTLRSDVRLPDGERKDSLVYALLSSERPNSGSVAPGASGLKVRAALPSDAEAMAAAYNEGIEDRVATFETRSRTAEDIRDWFDCDLPKVVVELNGTVVAFAAAFPYSDRCCYGGIAEFSVYVRRHLRGRGLGTVAMEGLVEAAVAHGLHKLMSRVFPENRASLAVLRRLGFRTVGTHRSHGRLDGAWKDCVCVERVLHTSLSGDRAPG
ncbi:MAG: GNAT family N-acetyltransferase [Armatimonadetes bacterium]|nr:GNAT family N-acetyltransferase [Armatimonadota bacterium]